MNMKVENEMALPTTKSVAVMLLEPYAGKLARTVLRGESSRKGADLLDMASTLCLILQERNHIQFPLDLEYYSFYFMSIRKQITSRLKDGTSKLSISQDKFKNYLIEYIPIQEQRKRKEIIKQRKRDLEELKRQEKTLEETLYDL